MLVVATALAFQLSSAAPPVEVTALVARARAARVQQDSMLASYRAVLRQRMSMSIGVAAGLGLGPIGRDRLAGRMESVARIGWDHRYGAWGEILAARAVVPIIGIEKPEPSYDDGSLVLPYYPGRDRLWPMSELRDAIHDHGDWIAHPLYAGADSLYDFSIGASMTIRLPDQHTIDLREIQVRPRRPASKLIVGSLWVDVETGNLVRVAYRPSVPMDLWPFFESEIGRKDRDKVKKFGPFTGLVREVVVDHGLYQGRFWLPRTRIASAEGSAKGAHVTVSIEQTFQYEDVTAAANATTLSAEAPDIDPVTGRVRYPAWRGVQQRTHRCRATGDSANAQWSPDSLMRDDRLTQMYVEGVRVNVLLPCDKQMLIDSPLLPGSIYATGEALFKDTDLAALRKEVEPSLGISRQAKWNPQPPAIFYGIDRDLLRFNRIEGLSAGVMVERELGNGYLTSGTIRIGLADRQPNAEATLRRTNLSSQIEATVYRRLAVANDWGKPLGPGASLSAALFGRDDGFYYRTLGAELIGGERSTTDRFVVAWRLFGEQQSTAMLETQRSLANIARGVRFRPNIEAREGIYWGGASTLRYNWGLDPRGVRLSGNTRVETVTGAETFVRAMTELTLTRGFGGNASASITGATGATLGVVPEQRLWYIGGPQTVHGRAAGAASGDAFWLARAELTKGNPLLRPVIFGDIGWAGARGELSRSPSPISAAGAGLSLVDGVVRFDVARRLEGAHGWRVDLYFELR
ncbi:MAG TPA: hypothetical protein VIP11_19140 [Gemmatimonadaceae bacterium]